MDQEEYRLPPRTLFISFFAGVRRLRIKRYGTFHLGI